MSVAHKPGLVVSVLVAVLALAGIALSGCGTTEIEYDTLYLSITTAPPVAGNVTHLDLALLDMDDGNKLKLPATPNDPEYQFALPDGHNLVAKAYVIRIVPSANSTGPLRLRVRGLDKDSLVLTSFSGIIDTKTKNQIPILLKAADVCDADGDGTPNCEAGVTCCAKGAASDCDDDPAKGGKAASPFGFEDPCTQCGNKIDEDCKGGDAVCLDTDKDGSPDCQETQCSPGAAADPSIFPGSPELCDDKDNDCDGLADEDLPISGDAAQGGGKKGDSCGLGVCAGGKIQCAPKDKDGKSVALQCDGLTKKLAAEDCGNQLDDDCDGKINNGCALKDLDGDGVDNDKEDAACKFKFARFHSEYHPGAAEPCCPAGKADDLCDLNCDGKVAKCAANDLDGDGTPSPLDCDDKDPLTFPDAPEKCGDGKVQACLGSDPACTTVTDKDGDGWSPGCAAGKVCDCNDGNAKVHPEAKETCDGADNDCDGVVDDGAPEASDQVCGDTDGECGKKTGFLVCKHYPQGQVPATLDCQSVFNDKSGTCVGCEGDNRPGKDLCDYLDNDCDGKSDEDYQYAEQPAGTKLQVAGTCGPDGKCKPTVACDGVGECAAGLVECNKDLDKAVCSTDPNGSGKQNKAEVCDNKDNDCNGTTDESLTAVSDSTCQKIGVCAVDTNKAVKTVCVSGKWLCDYATLAGFEFDAAKACEPGDAGCHCGGLSKQCAKAIEKSCDGLDNDCDGKIDDDFSYDDLGATKPIGVGCGTGACGGGKVVCTTDKKDLVCDTSHKIKDEKCDAVDNDCDAKTDELSDASMALDKSTCKQIGQCKAGTGVVAHTCPSGIWLCDYKGVPAYEGSAESTCDAKDNDCDGLSDEDFTYDDLGVPRKIANPCGTGACKEGTVVCTADSKNTTCSTLLANKKTETCNTFDDDCDGGTDEEFTYAQQDGKALPVLASCDGIGACGIGKVECTPGKTNEATCSTDPNGSGKQNKPESCNDADDDCDTALDENCDEDKDGYCDIAVLTVGKPKSCPQGGGDCQKGNPAVNPGVPESCDGVDNNCKDGTDEIFFYKEAGKDLGVGATCGLGVCSGGKVVCTALKTGATCDSLGKIGGESCNGLDDNCNGTVDEGCDDDKDGYCDVGMAFATSGAPICPNSKTADLRDCNDDDIAVNPGASEKCNNIDDNCSKVVDEGCDDDKDGYCDGAMLTVGAIGTVKVCVNGGADCVDDNDKINPGAIETCNNINDNCVQGADEGCDDDNDDFCDTKMTVVGIATVCPLTTNAATKDCNDDVAQINPKATEICNDIDDNCSGAVDDGCDKDQDGYCDKGMTIVGTPKVCAKTVNPGTVDCNDGNNAVNPGATEKCNNIDDNCALAADEGCDDDDDDYCDAGMTVVGAVNVCPLTLKSGDDCNDDVKLINPGATEVCDNIDNNCKELVDEGCDDDADGYCDKNMTVVGTPPICSKVGKDCNDSNKLVNPGKTEVCDLLNVDENCDGVANPPNSFNCTDYYKDVDGDKYGSSQTACLCAEDPGNFLTATSVGDCNDNNKAIHPGVLKDTCTTATVDDNCDGATDQENSINCTKLFLDSDSDNFGTGLGKCLCVPEAKGGHTATVGGDCDDKKPLVFPGTHKDTCTTVGVDDNCDGKTDEASSLLCTNYWEDKDGDKWGGPLMLCLCAANPATKYTATTSGDCNDEVKTQNPDVAETCTTVGVDDDCDGKTDETDALNCVKYYKDVDGDTFGILPAVCLCKADVAGDIDALKAGDCDDSKPDVKPGATEICGNGLDDDCNGKTDDVSEAGCLSKGECAGKTTVTCAASKWVCTYTSTEYEAGTELTCDGKDNDCDGTTDEDFKYTPLDPTKPQLSGVGGVCGYGECKEGMLECKSDKTGTRCTTDDNAKPEICGNSKDDNCNGKVNETPCTGG